MASSVVSEAGEYRDLVRTGAMEFELLVVFTNPPPMGEDFFTVVSKKDLVKVPLGVIPDGRMSDSARLFEHPLEYKSGKGRTPRIFNTCVFSRVERGKK